MSTYWNKYQGEALHELESMLESDDDLPSDYEEVLDEPAYLDDNRFDTIYFSWIKNKELHDENNKKQDIDLLPTQQTLQKSDHGSDNLGLSLTHQMEEADNTKNNKKSGFCDLSLKQEDKEKAEALDLSLTQITEKAEYHDCLLNQKTEEKSVIIDSSLIQKTEEKLENLVCYEDPIEQKVCGLKQGVKTLIQRGVLCKKDLVCLKSIKGSEACSYEALTTFCWLATFMVQKDLQADFKFLKSCLVNDTTSVEDTQANNNVPPNNNVSNLFKLDLKILE